MSKASHLIIRMHLPPYISIYHSTPNNNPNLPSTWEISTKLLPHYFHIQPNFQNLLMHAIQTKPKLVYYILICTQQTFHIIFLYVGSILQPNSRWPSNASSSTITTNYNSNSSKCPLTFITSPMPSIYHIYVLCKYTNENLNGSYLYPHLILVFNNNVVMSNPYGIHHPDTQKYSINLWTTSWQLLLKNYPIKMYVSISQNCIWHIPTNPTTPKSITSAITTTHSSKPPLSTLIIFIFTHCHLWLLPQLMWNISL